MNVRIASENSRRSLATRPCESLLAAATDYLSRGWPVIPLNGKVPAICWKEFQSRLPSPTQVKDWFSNSSLTPTGLGVVTGSISGLVVVDCDARDDAYFWETEHGSSLLTVSTGGGGVHIYYACPREELRNRAHLFGRRIDVRGEGGYVAVPPSIHPSGRRYEWLRFDSSTALPQFDPAWLLAPHEERTIPQSLQAKAVRNAWAYIRHIRAVAGEGGHNATFRAACKLRDAGLSVDEALAMFSDWNETNAFPPWSAKELLHKIESAFAVGK